VDALLGGGASASVADVRAFGQVERVDNGFRLVLNMGIGSTPSSRVFEARTCEELAGAAAIAIALLARSSVDSASSPPAGDSTAEGSPPPTEQPPPAAPVAQSQDPAITKKEPEAESASSPSSPLQLVIDAPVGVAVWGSLPSVGFGIGAAAGLRWRALRITAGGEWWHPQTNQVSGFDTRFRLQSGRAQACLTQAVHDFEWGPCLGATVQRLFGEGTKSPDPRIEAPVFKANSRSALWISGAAGLFASLATPGFAHLRFFGQASVLISPSRPRFTVNQLGPVHEPGLAAPRLELGTEWIF